MQQRVVYEEATQKSCRKCVNIFEGDPGLTLRYTDAGTLLTSSKTARYGANLQRLCSTHFTWECISVDNCPTSVLLNEETKSQARFKPTRLSLATIHDTTLTLPDYAE
uniref:Uncharacterized protein n=1 Tax=Timema poppense TaxID=170557 RepID=A0A7R9CWM7_TIMPO|nr:unnamed protein product [Timema poppensis]